MGYSFMKAKKVHLRELEERENTEAIKDVDNTIVVTILGLIVVFIFTIVNFFLTTMCSFNILIVGVACELLIGIIFYLFYEFMKVKKIKKNRKY